MNGKAIFDFRYNQHPTPFAPIDKNIWIRHVDIMIIEEKSIYNFNGRCAVRPGLSLNFNLDIYNNSINAIIFFCLDT